MQLRNSRRDRQAKACPLRRTLAKKALEHPLAQLGRHPRTAVLNPQRDAAVVGLHTDPDPPALRRVLHGIADKVLQQHCERVWIGHRTGVQSRFDIQHEILPARQRKRRELGQLRTDQRQQIQPLQLDVRGSRLQPGQGEQLLDHPRGTGDASIQLLQCFAPVLLIGRAGGVVRLDPQYRQGRAQLVRRVSQETFLPVQQLVDLQQQSVERRHHRRELRRRRCDQQGRKIVRIARFQHLLHLPQRTQAPAHGDPDQQSHQGQADQIGQKALQRDVAGQLATNLHALGDHHPLIIRRIVQLEHSPAHAARGQIVEARRKPDQGAQGFVVEHLGRRGRSTSHRTSVGSPRRAGRSQQRASRGIQHQERELAFVGMPDPRPLRPPLVRPDRPVERSLQGIT